MRVLYFIYQLCVFLPLFLVVTILCALITMLGSKFGNGDFWGYYPGRIWSRVVCFLALIPVEVRGRENIDKNTSYVFVANHQGSFDIFLIYGYLNHNFKWMMKKSLRNLPFVGRACQDAGHIFVDDSGATGIRRTIEQAKDTLRHGMSLVVFPEGSRTLDGKMHRFKKGAYQLAYDINLPVVPLTIEGPYKVLKRGTKVMSPHKMILTIHKPIPLESRDESEVMRLLKESREVIAASLGES